MEGDGAWWWVFWLVKMVLRSEGGECCEKKQSVSVVGGCWGLWGTAGGATDGA